MSDADIAELLEKCCRNNKACDVTGIMLYADGNFMQALEGPRAELDRLERKIAIDPRHRDMTTLLRLRIAHRLFATGSTELRHLVELPESAQPVVRALIDPKHRQDGPTPAAIMDLLKSFKRRNDLRGSQVGLLS